MFAVRIGSVLVCLPLALCAVAQQPKGSVGALLGGLNTSVNDRLLSAADLARLAPGSQLLQLTDSMARQGSGAYWDMGATVALEYGFFPFRNAERNGPELRVGILSMGNAQRDAFYQRRTSTTVDTLVSPTTGHTVIIDSVDYRTVSVSHGYQRLGVTGALHWSTQGRWALSAGIGLNGGILFNARTTISYTEGGYGGHWDRPGQEPAGGQRTEQYENGNGWWAGMHVPLGLSFALGREDRTLSRLRLGYELSWHLMHEDHAELGSGLRTFGRHMVGLRYGF